MLSVRLVCIVLCLVAGCVRAGFDAQGHDGPVGDLFGSDLSSGEGPMDSGGDTLDARDQGPAGLCAGFSGILCDDFESTLDQWTLDPAQGTVGITTGAARTGAGGLHVTLDGSGRAAIHADFDPISSGPIYISAWVRLPATPKLTDWLVLYELRRASPSAQKISLDGHWGDRFQINVATAGIAEQSNADALPRGSWTCMELYVEIAESGSAWVRVDGARLEVTSADTLPEEGSFNRVMVGLSSPGPAMEASFDDVRIGHQVYGCSGQGK
jgi:hypothetical protein